MARSGAFNRSLTPFGSGRLNIDDAYRVETPIETTHAPDPAKPPATPASGTVKRGVPKVKPPVVGKVPHPRTAAPKPKPKPAARPKATVKRPVAKAAPKKLPRPTGRSGKGSKFRLGNRLTPPKPPTSTPTTRFGGH